LQERYVKALGLECEQTIRKVSHLQTIFLGGGTPTCLQPDQLATLFSSIFTLFEIDKDTEVSIEVNPGTIDREKLDLLLACGVNRISIGVQSFIDRELRAVGRIHSAQEAENSIKMAKAAGFKNVSIDMMYGLPKQTPESWKKNLEITFSLQVQHLSLYQLTVEETTPMERMIREGTLQLPDDDAIADMDALTTSLTAENSFFQYEISNYAQDTFQCRHNINYWENNDYYGIGAGAVGYLQGSRVKNIVSPEDYCTLLEFGQSVLLETECLSRAASFRESIIMGLRMNRGVSIKKMQDRYGLNIEQFYGKTGKRLQAQGFLEYNKENMRLTALGRTFANMVMAELV